ncbi:hypothetical protein M917_0268 [Psychrobacter aquaticus CMS 56]|uniref:Uncharacterized protein n=1 Tax=Psychrobacter aquaticus CMS 56 TaxID=1354303 RepID=U4TDW3_9GAMM|nr:hypothetical protein M917_0268 [Psychrobacter aquaticus CMS 56]
MTAFNSKNRYESQNPLVAEKSLTIKKPHHSLLNDGAFRYLL